MPFYREASWPVETVTNLAELACLSVTRKADLHMAGRTLVSETFAHEKLLEVHSGGTTRTPLTVYCDAGTLQRNYAFFSRFRGWAGVPDGCRVATSAGRVLLRTDAAPPYWRHNRAGNAMLSSPYHISPSTVSHYADALAAWAPAMIDSYPSSIEPIARYLLSSGDTRIRPRAVITSSETLFPEVQAVVERAFGCPVFDYYGSAEWSRSLPSAETARIT